MIGAEVYKNDARSLKELTLNYLYYLYRKKFKLFKELNSVDIKEILTEQDIYRFIMNVKDEKLRRGLLSECKLLKYKAEDVEYISTEGRSSAYAILSGRINVRVFLNESTDYVIPWENKNWYGAMSILAEDYTECEIIFLEDTNVLSFPLKALLEAAPQENFELLMRLMKMGAKAFREVQVQNIKRAALSTEAYFLSSFKDNDYRYDGLSIPDISYLLKINTRTLQRVIQALENKNLIVRDKVKKIIYAKDRDKIDDYLESIS